MSGAKGPNERYQLRTVIRAQNGRVIQSKLDDLDFTKSDTQAVLQDYALPKPHLWNGRGDAYLYTAEVRILKNGRESERVTQTFGLRFFGLTAEGGFFLNGRHLELRGVNMHQDWHGLGWALTHRERAHNIGILRDLGANAVRLSHYPHHQETLDLLDRNGFVAWAEIPVINKIPNSAKFAETSRTQLIEMIRQQFNHPSIFFWSLFNEIDGDPIALIPELNRLAHSEDPSRRTVGASNQAFTSELNRQTDAIAINRYDGWYFGKIEDSATQVESAHAVLAGIPLGVSEYGAGGSLSQHQEPPLKPEPAGKFHPEEYLNLFHEINFENLSRHPYLWGHFIWCLFDFSSLHRNEGDAPGINDKGLVAIDHVQKKDAFYFYRAHWNQEPTLYLTSRRYTNRTNPLTAIKVYSNLERVRLRVNGADMGERTRAGESVIFTWDDIHLLPGKNTVQVSGLFHGKEMHDEVAWTLHSE